MKTKIITLVISALVILAPCARAQALYDYDELGEYIEGEFKKSHIPGMGVAVVDAENILFEGAYGDCDSLDSSFIIGSLTKSFTAAAVMQLVEQGKILLDGPITLYLPEIDKSCHTTVRQLLNQTSGIKTYMRMENYSLPEGPSGYQYANVNYGLLGLIIENTSGLGYGEYIQRNIFGPLGMAHSYVSLEAAQAGSLIGGHRNYFGFMAEETMKYPQDKRSGWITLPAGYLISSTGDMARYLQAYLKGGGAILSGESVDAMLYDRVYAAEDYMYGLGWGSYLKYDRPIITHGGNVENYTTNMFLLPGEGLAVITMYNAGDYLVANDIMTRLSYNIVYRLMGEEPSNIGAYEYILMHILINAALLALILMCCIPLIRIKRWAGKYGETGLRRTAVFVVAIHGILPTLLLALIPLLGIPLFVVRGFAPDIFIVLVICSSALYIAGIIKTAFLIRAGRRRVYGVQL